MGSTISVTLPQNFAEKVHKEAGARGMTKSSLIKIALYHYFYERGEING